MFIRMHHIYPHISRISVYAPPTAASTLPRALHSWQQIAQTKLFSGRISDRSAGHPRQYTTDRHNARQSIASPEATLTETSHGHPPCIVQPLLSFGPLAYRSPKALTASCLLFRIHVRTSRSYG